jgi:hypothetical protein
MFLADRCLQNYKQFIVERVVKITNSKKSKMFWIIGGFLKILDGLIEVMSFGTYSGRLHLRYLTSNR